MVSSPKHFSIRCQASECWPLHPKARANLIQGKWFSMLPQGCSYVLRGPPIILYLEPMDVVYCWCQRNPWFFLPPSRRWFRHLERLGVLPRCVIPFHFATLARRGYNPSIGGQSSCTTGENIPTETPSHCSCRLIYFGYPGATIRNLPYDVNNIAHSPACSWIRGLWELLENSRLQSQATSHSRYHQRNHETRYEYGIISIGYPSLSRPFDWKPTRPYVQNAATYLQSI
jgi:hypothetical protein